MKAKTVEDYTAEATKLSDDDLITEFGLEYGASDRACSEREDKECANALTAFRDELLKRMKK